MIAYLTYAEPPSGVYSSQVTDVIRYIRELAGKNIRLIAFISLHDFSKSRAQIRRELPGSVVLPMLPKATYWRINILLLWLVCIFIRPKAIIARNVIAANMALAVRGKCTVKKVCFDGRGAIAAEWKEYDVKVVPAWKKEIDRLEKRAVNESDFRIAVSEKLVYYWYNRYGYTRSDHVVIPCTLNSSFGKAVPGSSLTGITRENIGLDEGDTVLVYSGSVSGWQSFHMLAGYLAPFLSNSKKNKVLFLASRDKNIDGLAAGFPGQVIQRWVKHSEVPSVLAVCDMGVLIREDSVTNQVASPTKFAEYLSAGLPVIISENLGDYSDFVRKYHCGMVINGQPLEHVEKPDHSRRAEMAELVRVHFTKDARKEHYLELTDALK